MKYLLLTVMLCAGFAHSSTIYQDDDLVADAYCVAGYAAAYEWASQSKDVPRKVAREMESRGRGLAVVLSLKAKHLGFTSDEVIDLIITARQFFDQLTPQDAYRHALEVDCMGRTDVFRLETNV
jgi:hypothetical protein